MNESPPLAGIVARPYGAEMLRLAFAIAPLLLASTAARADAFTLVPSVDVALAIAEDAPSEPPAQPLETYAERPAWGEKGSLALTLTAGWATDFSDADLLTTSVGVSWFPVRMLSLDLVLDGVAAWQPGDDAVGGGVAFLFRWHFLESGDWTLYLDAGCGILGSNERIPADGTSFNFTPRAGVGATYRLDDRTRLMGGFRWFHISNAETSSRNPGWDGLQLYAGLSWGF